MIKLLIAFLSSFFVSLILMPITIKLLKKLSAGQTILGYVEEHKNKNGTTTMGGIIFIFTTLVLSFVFLKYDTLWFVTLIFSLFFGVLGFMDDFLKVKYKQNLGLRPYQKIIGQLGLSIIFAIFIYFFTRQNGNIIIPFTDKSVNIKFFIIPLIVLVLIATTNSVNLTDGIDGLSGSVSIIYLVFFVIICSILKNKLYLLGNN